MFGKQTIGFDDTVVLNAVLCVGLHVTKNQYGGRGRRESQPAIIMQRTSDRYFHHFHIRPARNKLPFPPSTSLRSPKISRRSDNKRKYSRILNRTFDVTGDVIRLADVTTDPVHERERPPSLADLSGRQCLRRSATSG